MKKAIGFLYFILSFDIIALTQCAPTDEGFGSTTTSSSTSSSTTTTLQENPNTNTFVFKPGTEYFNYRAYLNDYSLQNVYLCGDFNNWSMTGMPMQYDAVEEQYVYTNVMNDGSYTYKFRTIWTNTSGSSHVEWFVDQDSTGYVYDGMYGLNSTLTLPVSSQTKYTITATLTNAEEMPGYIYVYNTTYTYNNLANIITVNSNKQVVIENTARDYLELDFVSLAAETNDSVQTFDVVYWGSAISSSISAGTVDCYYDTASMVPAFDSSEVYNSIDFTWNNPAIFGTVTGIILQIRNSFDYYSAVTLFSTNLSPSVTSFHFSGISGITAGNIYYWRLIYNTSEGWGGMTKYMKLNTVNI